MEWVFSSYSLLFSERTAYTCSNNLRNSFVRGEGRQLSLGAWRQASRLNVEDGENVSLKRKAQKERITIQFVMWRQAKY